MKKSQPEGFGKKAYISGPITGIANQNRERFFQAQDFLTKKGYTAINPHDLTKELINDEETRWEEYMKIDIAELVKCDVLFVFGNWEASKGATMELFIAQKLKIPIYYLEYLEKYEVLEPFKISFQIVKIPV